MVIFLSAAIDAERFGVYGLYLTAHFAPRYRITLQTSQGWSITGEGRISGQS
jgi:hypothetical protein